MRESDAVVALRFALFYPFSLSAAGTKALGPEQQQHLGLQPYEWARVNGTTAADEPGLVDTDSE